MSNKRLDLNLYRVFDRVITQRSISAAAASLDMTPAAVSQSIRRLAHIVGTPLFHREGRGITPTSYALMLHREVFSALHIMERSLLINHSFDPLTSERVFRVASHPDLDLLLLPNLLRHLARVAPYCKLEFVPGIYQEAERQQALSIRNIDLVLSSTAMEGCRFINQRLFTLELRVVCRANHPRINDTINCDQFFAEEHVVWDIRRQDDWVVRSLVSDYDFPPRKLAYEGNSQLTALSLISQTDWLGVTSLRHLEMMPHQKALKDFPLPWNSAPCPIYASWHQSTQKDYALSWLIRELQLVASEMF